MEKRNLSTKEMTRILSIFYLSFSNASKSTKRTKRFRKYLSF